MRKIAILGFGVVGAGVAEVITMNKDKMKSHLGDEIEIKYIVDIRDFPDSPFGNLITHNADDVFGDPEVDVVVETIGGAKIAYEFTKKALSSGKSVVTSNKELVSTHGVELMQLAEDNSVSYLYEAAVGGGIPIIRPLHRCLAANKINRIAGIVNGTTNYILSSMKLKGLSYSEALSQAQANGYAEADPTADVDGIDAQRKLSILSTIALSGEYVSPDLIHTTGIRDISLDDIEFANKIGCNLKLLAFYTHPDNSMPACFVAPHIVSNNEILSSVEDVFNAILVEGNALGESLFYGQGAGKLPTASAVVGDVLDAILHVGKDAHIRKWYKSSKNQVVLPYEEIVTNIIVKAASSNCNCLKDLFSDYDTEVILDDSDASAIIVKDIKHKDIDSLVNSVVGGTWFHYMA